MSKQTHKHKSRRFRRFLRANNAVSALEYAVLVGIIAVGISVAIATFGGNITKAMNEIGKEVAKVDVGTAPAAQALPQGAAF